MHAELSSICCVPLSHDLKKNFEKVIVVCWFCDDRRAILRTYSRKANPIFKK